MDFAQAIDATATLIRLGMKAVTLTGGGEPLLYPKINELIMNFIDKGIEVSLATNGLRLDRLKQTSLRSLTWCRVSCSDEQSVNQIRKALDWAVGKAPEVDWGFSYVVTDRFDPANLMALVEYANKNNFTHVRIICDLLRLDKSPPMAVVKKTLRGTDDSLVIYQGRKEYLRGQKHCYVSLLRPVLGPDGMIYPCCGVQYAKKKHDLDFASDMQMGDFDSLDEIYQKQKWFDGHLCDRCYYDEYNRFIGALLSDMKHGNFV